VKDFDNIAVEELALFTEFKVMGDEPYALPHPPPISYVPLFDTLFYLAENSFCIFSAQQERSGKAKDIIQETYDVPLVVSWICHILEALLAHP
jgi:hypothetical protein